MAGQVLFLYGSQTGIAESICKGLSTEAEKKGYVQTCQVMDHFQKETFQEFVNSKVVVMVCSTTGDGEIPDNAIKFFRALKLKSNPKDLLQNVNFTMLALGDTNYSDFCQGGKKISQRILELGAKEFYPRGYADDGTGLDVVVEPWIENLWGPLADICSKIYPNGVQSEGQNGVVKDEKVENGVVENGKIENGIEKVTEDLKKLEVNDEQKLTPKKVTEVKSRLIINIPEQQEVLKGIPKVPDSFIKVKYHENETRDPVDAHKILYSSTDGPYSITSPFPAKVHSIECLTSEDAVKRTLSIELDISGSNMSYVPGDSFGFVCPNNESEVKSLIQRLNLEPNAVLTLETESNQELPKNFKKTCSVFECLSYFINVTTLTKKILLRVMAEYTSDANEKYTLLYLMSRAGGNEFQNLRQQDPSVLELLNRFPSCALPLERLLENTLPLQPRYYSVCNSPQFSQYPRFAFNIITYETPSNYTKEGLCTNWLNNLYGKDLQRSQGKISSSDFQPIPIFHKATTDFCLPEDPSIPLIFIGPGTGVTPFIGFLQHRKVQKLENPNQNFASTWLFYGCRDRTKDYLYKEEIEGFEKDGLLNRLSVTYSRETTTDPGLKYVHQLMRVHSTEIYELLMKQNAILYVCGDAKGMSQDVNLALEDILCSGGMESAAAKKQLIDWSEERRIRRDIWA